MKAGRPTTYDPDLGERIIELMSQGLSLVAAAAECDVHRQRVYEWKDRHPDFADLVNLAMGKRQLFLERKLIGASSSAEATASIFGLKNAAPDDWREKQEVAHSGEVTSNINLSNLTPEQLEAIASISLAGE